LRDRATARARGRSRARVLARCACASPEIESKTSSDLGLLPPPRAPGLPGSRLIVRKSGRPDLRWGRAGEGGGAVKIRMAPPAKESHYPHPQPLPTRGRGAHRVRGKNVLQAQPNKLGTLRFGSRGPSLDPNSERFRSA